MTNAVGRFSLWFSVCILLPNSLCSGLISPRFTPLGRLLIPRRDPTAMDGLLAKSIDLTMLGHSAFRVRNLVLFILVVRPRNMLTNSWLTAPCPILGLSMLLSLFRNRLDLLVRTSGTPQPLWNTVMILLVLFRCSRLRLMKM